VRKTSASRVSFSVMPQPLSRMPWLKRRTFGGAFETRPKHMEAAFRIIVAGSTAEHRLKMILVGISKEPIKTAKHINSLESEAKKQAVYDAISLMVLPDRDHELLKKLWRNMNNVLKLRHAFAHNRFGYSADDDDLLLVVDMRYELVLQAAQRVSFLGDEVGTAQKVLEDHIMGYKLKELQEIEGKIKKAEGLLTQFWIGRADIFSDLVGDDILDELDKDLRSLG